jgi:Ankyrin repeats (3 copies)
VTTAVLTVLTRLRAGHSSFFYIKKRAKMVPGSWSPREKTHSHHLHFRLPLASKTMMQRRGRTILSSLLIILLWSCDAVKAEDNDDTVDPFEDFLFACSEGNMEVLEIMLEEHPDFVAGQSQQGESCLHAAGILGQTAVTKAVLKAGGDPNVRSTFAQGLRMTPLSWNVFGGHVENARVLLEAGAKVNLDFDHMIKGGGEKITALDILYIHTLEGLEDTAEDMSEHPEYKKHYEMRDLLLEYGAKRYADLVKEEQEL